MTSSLYCPLSKPLNVYKTQSLECVSMLFIAKHIPYLWGLSNFLQQLHWFLQQQVRKNKASIMAVVLKLHVSSCKMFTFCDVLHETKQKVKVKKKCLECAIQTGNFNAQELIAECSNFWSGFFFCWLYILHCSLNQVMGLNKSAPRFCFII